MKYGKLDLGQIEAIVNKLGGMDGVKEFLSDKTVGVHKLPLPPEETIPYCTIVNTGVKAFMNYSNKDLRGAVDYLENWDDRDNLVEFVKGSYDLDRSDQKFGPTKEQGTVHKCIIERNHIWPISIFREILSYDGPDEHLAQAFVARDLVWTIKEVVGYILNIIHKSNDPLGLSESLGTRLFPVVMGPVECDDSVRSWRPALSDVLRSVKWMRVFNHGDLHLGKPVWKFRVSFNLEEALSRPDVDQRFGKGNVIYLRQNPAPVERGKGIYFDPSVHSWDKEK